MLDYINFYIQNNRSKEQYLVLAKQNLEKLINKNISFSFSNNWSYWHTLRCIYSDYRFSVNKIDKQDHLIYTDYFLKIGDK